MITHAAVQNAAIVRHLITLLEGAGDWVSYSQIAREILKIDKPSPRLTRRILSGLLSGDARFLLEESGVRRQSHRSECSPLQRNTYVVIDLETTGADASTCRVTELAFIKVREGRIAGEFTTLVNPERPVPPFISAMTGITDAMVRQAPKFKQVAEEALEFLGDSVVVAHNAKFDVKFLSAELDRAIGLGLGLPNVCTLQTARHIVHGLPNYQLQTVAAHYAVEIQGRHRAGGDARATAQVWIKMVETLESYGVPSLSVARGFRLFPQHSLL